MPFRSAEFSALIGKTRHIRAPIYGSAAVVILGLIGVISWTYIIAGYRYLSETLPYAYTQVWPHVLTAAQEQALKPGDAFKECAKDCPEMVVVPAGSFLMGGPNYAERPQHMVMFANLFAVSKYEVTFADWNACVVGGGCNGYTPNSDRWGRGQQPVINVSWDDAQQYVVGLSRVTGRTYRLLSEAEYEHAARAGTTTAYPWGDDIGRNNTNCNGCGSKWDNIQPAPVGSFPANKFGLYDMEGNVSEWTEDCLHYYYDGAPTDGSAWIASGDCAKRVVRGTSWTNPPLIPGVAYRIWDPIDTQMNFLSFRVARPVTAGPVVSGVR